MLALDSYPQLKKHIIATYPERPEQWKPLTLEQAEAFFSANAVLCCERDVVPVVKALELFGWRIVFMVNEWDEHNKGRYMNAVGLNDCMPGMLDFFNRSGFLCAISLANQMTLFARQQAWNEVLREDFD